MSSELEAFEGEAQIVVDRIVEEQARVESLTTLARIEEVAGPLGLRQAVDAELVQVNASDADSGVGGNR